MTEPHISLLSRLVSYSSIYPNEKVIGTFFVGWLKQRGFIVETQKVTEKRYNIFASRGKGDKSLLFYGHQDTVPLVRESEWKTDPFQLTEHEGNLYGLGAYDMKGGIAAFLTATAQSDRYVKVFLAVDEENISAGGWAAVKEKSDFFHDVSLVVSAEPNFGLGLSGITTGRTGRCVFTLSIQGKPVHIADFRSGDDAIKTLGTVISTLYKNQDNLQQETGTVVQIRKVMAESVGMSVCGDAAMEVEVLLAPTDTIDAVQQRLSTLLDQPLILKPRATPYLPGYQFSTFPHQDDISNIITQRTSKSMTLHTRQSVGDDNALATLGIPVITWGPDGGNAHAPNEYIEKQSLNTLLLLFIDLLKLTG